MKRLFLIVVISSLMLLAIPINSAYAASVFTIGSTQYTNDGQTVQMDAAPFIEGNRTFLPVRYIANALGVPDTNIYYNPITHMVTLTKGNSVISLVIGSTSMFVTVFSDGAHNETTTTMDVAPEILDGRTFLPIAWIAQAFGVNAAWDATSRTITLDDNSSSQQTVPPIPATPSITMTTFNVAPGAINEVAGNIVQLKVTATMSDGSTADITSTASYSSSNASVSAVSVSPIGLVIGVAQGTATITVTDSGLSANIPVTVSAPAVQPSTTLPSNTSQPSTVNPPIVAPYNPPTYNPPTVILPTTNNQENQEAQIAIERQTEENIIATAQQNIDNLKTNAQNETNQIQKADNSSIQTYSNMEQQEITQVDSNDSARGTSSSVIGYDEQQIRNEFDPLIQGVQSDEENSLNSINQNLQNGINQQEQTIEQAQATLQQLNSGQ